MEASIQTPDPAAGEGWGAREEGLASRDVSYPYTVLSASMPPKRSEGST